MTSTLQQSIAVQRYLERHQEPGLNQPPAGHAARWQHVVVIPSYREKTDFLSRLAQLTARSGNILVIVVLNRPDTDADRTCNDAMRQHVETLEPPAAPGTLPNVKVLSARVEVLLVDTEKQRGPLPHREGVGLARKIGCDLALSWIAAGVIDSQWIHVSDADASLPPDYFDAVQKLASSTAAACYPFLHGARENRHGGCEAIEAATALYELRLHHYVLGLRYAGSPYAFHTLGSCLALRPEAYAQVRGFPKRAAAEDFYLLNKIAKTGAIANARAHCIILQARTSSRVPFGTGPAVQKISEAGDDKIFYHPACFEALRATLISISQHAVNRTPGQGTIITASLLPAALHAAAETALQQLGIENALDHCDRQSTDDVQFMRQFHQWFDGFRTLKFIHALRDSGWPNCSLSELENYTPQLWPTDIAPEREVKTLRNAVVRHMGWELPEAGN